MKSYKKWGPGGPWWALGGPVPATIFPLVSTKLETTQLDPTLEAPIVPLVGRKGSQW